MHEIIKDSASAWLLVELVVVGGKGRQEQERAGSQRRKDTSCLPMNGAPATEKGELALDLLQAEVTSLYLIITLCRGAFLTLFSPADASKQRKCC